ncbi:MULTISPECIES: hypothetical protein [Pseudomonas]|jgi:hypothetical protein|uniref:Lipoprotein n=1 Tax=Pseudomonas oryzihabitans TaxID=47885 RepID=A0A2Z5A239_9PSED|nr:MULTISPECIES: hypothetical protein [Pseudomonas]AXA64283.1 hypothetical protein CE139_00200 [Pseudomonas oryzihabitans]MDQ7913740.1 hypothetical protein [Pseudomonas sp. 102515]MDR6180296.1 putative lipoprotein YajG [Pseudomonas sp. SORGH_AS_0211]
MRTPLLVCSAVLMLAGCAGGNADKACAVFAPPPAAAATPTAQNGERVDTLTGNASRPASGCAQ